MSSILFQGDYDQAFQYYYQATQFASPSFVLPQVTIDIKINFDTKSAILTVFEETEL